MALLYLGPTALGMINAIDTSTSLYNLYFMQESSDHADVKHPSQYYNISYSSTTGEESYHNITDYDKTEWTRLGFNCKERYNFTIIPVNDFITGEKVSLWCVQ